VPAATEDVTNGRRKRAFLLHGLEGRVPPTGHGRAIRADGKVVKAKAFTKKRR